MRQKLPTRRMREHPDLEQLKRQAKELLRGFAAGETGAAAEVELHYHHPDASRFALHDAQLVIARSYGFESWPKLKAYVDGVTVRRLEDAIRAGAMGRVRAMLDRRPELADMQMSYGDERRPIHFAVMARSPEMVRLLMQRGANARAGIDPHRDATSARTIAEERGFDEIVAIIDEEERKRPAEAPARAPEQEIRDADPARAAVASGDIEWLRERHAEGALVNAVRWHDGGLLTAAVKHNQPEILRLLLESGFDPDERVSAGEGDWVAYSQGYPLWCCAAAGRREMAEILLAHGANPNVHVDSSGSAVYSAYSHRQWDMVELLRQHGGIVTADIAATYRQTELARQILAENSSAAGELLQFGAGGGDPEIVRMALERIDWAGGDPRWFRPLISPLSFWHHIPWLYAGNRDFDRGTYLDCFRLILQRSGPNVTGGFMRTALHEVAAMGSHVTGKESAAFARALLDAGARSDIRDDILRSTPFGWACRWGREEMVRLFLERRVDPEEPDAEPWAKPLAWAVKSGHRTIADILQRHRESKRESG